MKTICFVAGGSGGHIIPALTLSEKWADENNGKVIFFTSSVPLSKDLDKKLLNNKPWVTSTYFSGLGKPPRRLLLLPVFIIQILWTFIKSVFVFLFNRPQKIVSTGGYVSIPVCLAGKLLGIPVELYEVNATPGKAAKVLAWLAGRVNVTFESCVKFFPKNGFLVAYPVRFVKKDRAFQKSEIAKELGFDEKRKTIFICCGSQGSMSLNKIFRTWVENKDFYDNIQVIHQTGAFDPTDWHSFYKGHNFPYLVFDYLDDVKKFYQIADVVICRAGAGTLFELKFFHKKSLVVPLKTGYTSHQLENAICIAKGDPELFTCLDQVTAEQAPEKFKEALLALL